MVYENMPLYPRMGYDCDRDACVRVPVFGGARFGAGRLPEECATRRVTIENPCHPGERAEVLLSVDECGNLVVCVKRDCRPSCDCHRPPRSCPPPCPPCPPPCPPNPCPPPCPPPRPRRDGCRGRLYGSWR